TTSACRRRRSVPGSRPSTTSICGSPAIASPTPPDPPTRKEKPMSAYAALATLSRRRFALSAHTPREIVVPLITPVLFALMIAPALNEVVGGFTPGIDYISFVALGTVGLLIPLNTMFAGLGVIVDRQAGARRELLAAPIRRSLLVLSNLTVALSITAPQVVVL